MFALSGEKRAAEEAVKTISRFSQGFQSEKSLLDLSKSMGVLSPSSVVALGRFRLASSIAEDVELCSTEATSEVASVGAWDGACEESRFSAGILRQAGWIDDILCCSNSACR